MYKLDNRMFYFLTVGFVCLLLLSLERPVFAQQTLRGAVLATSPSIPTATSFQVLGFKLDRATMFIQNNSAAPICCSVTGATLSAIAPSAINLCFVIAVGGTYIPPTNLITTSAVTCYQTSGLTINTVYVHEG